MNEPKLHIHGLPTPEAISQLTKALEELNRTLKNLQETNHTNVSINIVGEVASVEISRE